MLAGAFAASVQAWVGIIAVASPLNMVRRLDIAATNMTEGEYRRECAAKR